MNTKTLLLTTAGILALALTGPALAQSTETLSLNYERIPSAQAGIEPDEIDARATDDEPQAGLLLPAVQNVQAASSNPAPLTPVYMDIEDIDGESTDSASASQANAAPSARPEPPAAGRPRRAARRSDRN